MATRSSWKGVISFGALNIPCKLYKAYDDNRVSFHLLHKECGERINQIRVCNTCGIQDISMDDIVRGYQVDSETNVVFTKEDLESLPGGIDSTVRLISCVKNPDPLLYENSYFLHPEKSGEHALSVLVGAMKKTKQSLGGVITQRDQDRPCVIWIRNGAPVLSTMIYQSQVRDLEWFSDRVSSQEIGMAAELLSYLGGEMPVRSEYADAVAALAEKKVQDAAYRPVVKKFVGPTEPVDIMDVLRVELAKRKRGDG